MNPSQLSRWRGASVAALAATVVLLASGSASALQVTLDVELDSGLAGTFATVDITENAGRLDFSITLDPSLGSLRDLDAFYFNIIGTSFSGLTLSTTDNPLIPYTLIASPSVLLGAGSFFDFAVDFANGDEDSGNGRHQTASFTLSADQPLSITDLLESSTASGGADGPIDIQFALRAESTNLIRNHKAEAVGGNIVPEPSTAVLACVGLLSLAARGRALKLARRT